MTMFWTNLLAWSLQVAVITAAAALLPSVWRVKASRARLWYWRVVLVICLALPVVQPWAKPAVQASRVTMTTGPFRVAEGAQTAGSAIPWAMLGAALLAAGTGIRLLWLAAGLVKLRRYRRIATPFAASEQDRADLQRLAPRTEIKVSGGITGPVTFGLRHPVVLLPERFRDLGDDERRSILCHELLHVRRRDWGFVVAEELIRAAVWFHPAVWWLLGRIQVTREQVVDEAVIEYTGNRDRYLDALLAIASQHLSADLAPAPLFLKKRHLRQRVESIVSGVPMTKRNLLLPLAAALATLPVVIGIAAWQFPLRAAPPDAVDDSGVEVELGTAKVLHRSGVLFPDAARAKQISGTVVIGVTVDDQGEVTGAQALSGPDVLRKAVVQSVSNWHFALDSADAPRTFQVTVQFDGAHAGAPSATSVATLLPHSASDIPRTVDSINYDLLPPALREKVMAAGAIHVGDVLTAQSLQRLNAALLAIDDHLGMTGAIHGDKVSVLMRVRTPKSGQPALANPPGPNGEAPKMIRVGGAVQAQNVIQKVQPVYPPEAKAIRLQGTVRLTAYIGADGLVKNLEVVSGHPMLVTPAVEAVKEWVYKPTLLNGNPVDVITTIDINFTLAP